MATNIKIGVLWDTAQCSLIYIEHPHDEGSKLLKKFSQYVPDYIMLHSIIQLSTMATVTRFLHFSQSLNVNAGIVL